MEIVPSVVVDVIGRDVGRYGRNDGDGDGDDDHDGGNGDDGDDHDDDDDSATPDREGCDDDGDRCMWIGNAPYEDRVSSGRMRPLRWVGAAMASGFLFFNEAGRKPV